jgi:hypothetical protein
MRCASAQPTTMTVQLFHHPETNDGFFDSMMKKVKTNETAQEFQFVFFSRVDVRCACI